MNKIIYSKFAHVLLEVALNLQKDETLVIFASPKDYEIVNELIKVGYTMGAKYVKTEYQDLNEDAIRCLYSDEKYLSYYPEWLSTYLGEMATDNVSIVTLYSPNPNLNDGINADKIIKIRNSYLECKKPFNNAKADGHVSWVKTCVPSVEWAQKVFPQLPAEEAFKELWENFIKVTRLDKKDPVKAWFEHKENIREKKNFLNSLNFAKLHFSGPGTNLEVNIVENATWVGGYDFNEPKQLEYIPNIPTEEIFCVPHKYNVNGTVTATLPLNYNGSIIKDFSFTIKDGKVIDFSAKEGYNILKSIVEHDAGSCYFGEVALVSVQSPIYRTGHVYYDTLLDENAVCHIALGHAPAGVVKGGTRMSDIERDSIGINVSGIHVDFMVGSDNINVDGTTQQGKLIPIMRNGDWVL